MQRRDITGWIRVGAVGFALLAAAATVFEAGREKKESAPPAPSPSARDPLAAELERCNALTPASGRDAACEHAWLENRRRFLGTAQDMSGPSRAVVEPTTMRGDAP
jgi:conjugative transfer region protein TrbK